MDEGMSREESLFVGSVLEAIQRHHLRHRGTSDSIRTYRVYHITYNRVHLKRVSKEGEYYGDYDIVPRRFIREVGWKLGKSFLPRPWHIEMTKHAIYIDYRDSSIHLYKKQAS